MANNGISSETPNPSPPPFSEEQITSLQALISAGLSAALESRGTNAPTGTGANQDVTVTPAQTRGTTGERGEGPAPDPENVPPQGTGEANPTTGTGNEPGTGQAEEGATEGAQEEEESSDPFESDSDDDPAETKLDAFSKGWHKQNRGRRIGSRFVIPARFSPLFPIGFKPETVEHFQTFSTGNASVGREEEAANLYNAAAYATVINNTLYEALDSLFSVEFLEGVSNDFKGQVGEALDKISDAQVAVYGTYELAASRYEVLCGKQGAAGVADPELLSAYIDAPAAYSAAGRQAFRQQQKQAVKSAAQQAGRRSLKRGAGARPPKPGGGAGGGGRKPSGGHQKGTKNKKSDAK